MKKHAAGPSSDATENYLDSRSEAIASLRRRLVARIRCEGPLGFDAFMAAALYDPQAGYYASQARQVGRAGDFFTSVSAGPLFGQLLARHLDRVWREWGRPEAWRIVEVGAHDGQLAADILAALPVLDGALAHATRYCVVEPQAQLAAAQRARLGERVEIHADAGELSPAPTVVLGNEVLDALPCRVVESTADGWVELGVDEHFDWVSLGAAGALAVDLPRRPAGYRTEVRPAISGFIQGLTDCLAPGRMLWIDYGYERDDYYAEGRHRGTLRTFSRHRAGDDPLSEPGRCDISAHVDFTALREATEAAGGEVLRFENQGRFLTELARPWLLEMEGRTDAAKALRNFQTLTHPAQLGSRFHVFEASWRGACLP
jgi:SAM-dependent MidA family methyltransferase